MSKQKTLLPVIALIVANVLWGINVPVIKLGVRSIPIPIFIAVRFMIVSLIFLPFAIRTWKPLRRTELGLMALSSLFFITVSAIALNLGLKYAPSINVAVIGLLGPLLLCVLSVEFLKEKMGLKAIIGVMLAFAGSAIIIGKPWEVSLRGSTVLLGNVLFFVVVLAGVISTLIAKPILNKISTYQATFLLIFIGTLPIVPFALLQLRDWSIHSVTPGGYAAFVYGIIALPIANFCFFYGLKHKKAHNVAVLEYVEPVAVIIAAWFILAERPSLKFALGAALTFLGIYLAEVRLPRKLYSYRLKKS